MIIRTPKARRHLVTAGFVSLLVACGSSSPPADVSFTAPPPSTDCSNDTTAPQTALPELLPSLATVETRNRAVDQFGNGFRIAGNAAELGYIDYLAQQFTALGGVVSKEPYTFTSWSAKTTGLEVISGPAPGPLRVAYDIPASGSTGPAGISGPVVYLSELYTVNFATVVSNLLANQNPDGLVAALQNVVANDLAGGQSLAQVVAAADVAGKIVMYDVPKVPLTAGAFYAVSTYVNDASGDISPTTPYSRPFVDMLAIPYINQVLQQAGAIGIVAVIDYPPLEADNSYYPFGAVPAAPGAPGLYLDRDTGTALKLQISAAGIAPVVLHLTLDATQAPATSYNLVAVFPGACASEILVSSHSDGPNAIEDNGPAAILSIADYFAHAPAAQRKRTLRVVISGGHFEGAFGEGSGGLSAATFGSPGMTSYISQHQAELTANTLTAIEIEHTGAREWQELSPGTMGLTGYNELAAIWTTPLTPQAQEATIWAHNFDRAFVTAPLPFGEGGPWSAQAGLPLIQFIPGPVYLLNGPMSQVADQFIDYDLERRQIDAFIQMILNLNTQTDSVLRAGANHLP